MARFSVGRDEDGNEEARRTGRPLLKKPRTSGSPVIVYSRATASAGTPSAANSRKVAANSDAPLASMRRNVRPEDSQAVELECDDESEMESDTSIYDSDELLSSSEEEEVQEQPVRVEERSSEGRVNSSPLVWIHAPTPVSVTLTDPDVLDCPICLEPLCSPVYQCENGHIACASCCTNMRNKCATCCFPIGYNRCRAIEKVLDSVKISCRNLRRGCKESIHYSKKHDHEKACMYSPCSCPYHGCGFVSMSEGLYMHFATEHLCYCKKFRFNSVSYITLESNQKHIFLQESNDNILFILDRTINSLGSLICLICVAPTSSKRRFSYEIAVKHGESSIRVKSVAVNTPKWIAQPREKKYFLVPSDFLNSCGSLTVELTIHSAAE